MKTKTFVDFKNLIINDLRHNILTDEVYNIVEEGIYDKEEHDINNVLKFFELVVGVNNDEESFEIKLFDKISNKPKSLDTISEDILTILNRMISAKTDEELYYTIIINPVYSKEFSLSIDSDKLGELLGYDTGGSPEYSKTVFFNNSRISYTELENQIIKSYVDNYDKNDTDEEVKEWIEDTYPLVKVKVNNSKMDSSKTYSDIIDSEIIVFLNRELLDPLEFVYDEKTSQYYVVFM